jgi:hypothetical protein
MITWETLKQTNEMGASWIESRFIEDGLRCCRVGRSYYAISNGSDWLSDEPAKTAKIAFVRGPTVDVKIKSKRRSDIRKILKFAFRCLCDPKPPPSLDSPIIRSYPKQIKHLSFRVRYYESTHPKYGRRFAGQKPSVSIEDLVEMIVDAHGQEFIRVPAKAFHFDPKD